jgi:hypothetical protein
MEEWTPLHKAAANCGVVTIRRMAAEGADVNVHGPGGAKPLHFAAANGMWMRYECLWRWGPRWRRLLLMDRHPCTLRHFVGKWQW